ncbi:MAG: toll/interleukin-1 receptor domain-containing protein, partial [Planktomarina sp.]
MTTQFTHPDKYDFFISHNSADKVIAEEVATKLHNLGYVVAFDAWYVALGGHLARWMDHAINNSDRLIAICSKDYFKPSAIYSAEERIDMWWGDMEGLNAAVIPFKVAECDLPRTLAVRLYASLSNGDVDAFIDQLLTPTGPPDRVSPATGRRRRTGPWHGFDLRSPIIGRDTMLAQLR